MHVLQNKYNGTDVWIRFAHYRAPPFRILTQHVITLQNYHTLLHLPNLFFKAFQGKQRR